MNAQAEGKLFEDQFEKACKRHKVHCVRLPEVGSRYIGKFKSVTKDVICDFIIGYKNRVCLCDTKSWKANASYTRAHEKSVHTQVKALKEFQNKVSHKSKKILACFVIYLKKDKKVCLFHAEQLFKLNKKDSLSARDAIHIIGTSPDNMNPKKIFEF